MPDASNDASLFVVDQLQNATGFRKSREGLLFFQAESRVNLQGGNRRQRQSDNSKEAVRQFHGYGRHRNKYARLILINHLSIFITCPK
jgi:hypothetical protein